MPKVDSSTIKTSLTAKIFLITSGVLLCLCILEIGLRLGGFIVLSVQDHRNAASIRQKGAYRILCIGESTTQNQYPPILETILNQCNMGITFSVIDEGVGGTNTALILGQLESNLDKYSPDMVIAMMGINDSGRHMPRAVKGTNALTTLRVYKLSRFLWLRILTKVREMGLFAPFEDFQDLITDTVHRPDIASRKASADSGKSESSLQKAIAANPEDDNACLHLGYLYREQGKTSSAEYSFRKAIELNPRNTQAYAALGWLYREQSKLAQSEDIFRKGIELNPDNYGIYIDLGHIYRDDVKYPQAEDVLRKAMTLPYVNNEAWVQLGRLYRDEGRLSEAKDMLNKAIKLDSKNPAAYVWLAMVYRDQRQLSRSLEALQKAIELDPQNDRIYGSIAILYREMANPEAARTYERQATYFRSAFYLPATSAHYRKLKETLDKRGIRLVCVQYPMRSIKPLKYIFKEVEENVVFVDNEKPFKDLVKGEGYNTYFVDMFGGDFGHCTKKGNTLLAENIARAIIGNVFKINGSPFIAEKKYRVPASGEAGSPPVSLGH